MNKCETTRSYYKKTKLATYVMLLILKVLRSTFLNIVIFLLGFSCGFMYLSSAVHHHAYQNQDYESLARLKQYLDDQRELDDHIDVEIKKLKHKMSYDVHPLYENCKLINTNKIKHVKQHK